jgi:hypothetical protein
MKRGEMLRYPHCRGGGDSPAASASPGAENPPFRILFLSGISISMSWAEHRITVLLISENQQGRFLLFVHQTLYNTDIQ